MSLMLVYVYMFLFLREEKRVMTTAEQSGLKEAGATVTYSLLLTAPGGRQLRKSVRENLNLLTTQLP